MGNEQSKNIHIYLQKKQTNKQKHPPLLPQLPMLEILVQKF